MTDSSRDILAVQEDALFIEIAATRGDLSAFADDPLATLFGAYAADIDDGLDLVALDDMVVTDQVVLAIPRQRSRRNARLLLAAGTVVAVAGTSGMAAAVTGDPFMPFRGAVHAVTGSGATTTGDDGQAEGDLPDQGADTADVALAMTGINKALVRGDLVGAQRLLDTARAGVGSLAALPPGLLHRLDAMQDKIDNGTDPASGSGKDNGGADQGRKNQSGKDNGGAHQGRKNQTKDSRTGSVDQTAAPVKGGDAKGSGKGRSVKSDPGSAKPASRNRLSAGPGSGRLS